MQAQQPSYPSAPTAVPAAVRMPHPETTRSSVPPPIDPNLRKRPLYPSDKPRAIQPRPPPSVASYSSESGTSAQLSPRLESTAGEPPRKRGRPSKAETERRKAAAEARGETYPPPRRLGAGRVRIPPSPTSPAGPPIAPYAHTNISQPAHGPNPSSIPFETSTGRPIAPATGLPVSDERRDMPTRSMAPSMRELPRPQEMSHPLPSPHSLQLGPPDVFSRLNSNPGERGSFGTIPPDRFSPDSSRRDSVASRGDPPPGPYTEGRESVAPGEKPSR